VDDSGAGVGVFNAIAAVAADAAEVAIALEVGAADTIVGVAVGGVDGAGYGGTTGARFAGFWLVLRIFRDHEFKTAATMTARQSSIIETKNFEILKSA
jgi:hypothetical protein